MSSNQRMQAGLTLRSEGDKLALVLSGDWALSHERPKADEVLAKAYAENAFSEVYFEVEGLDSWDTGLLIFVRAVCDWTEAKGLKHKLGELPTGVQNMISLSQAVPEMKHKEVAETPDFFSQVGIDAVKAYHGLDGYFYFIGQLVVDLFAFIRGKAQLRLKDFMYLLQSTGPMALMIVTLLSFLTGLIIAFIGVIQLQKFAADIYVADLVGLAITRELGAVMVGVIMAGRTGAAFAAQLGSMQVNEEIDALTSFGISPMQFLVVPRIIALVLMMPLLCVCADFVGILGGMVVAVLISDVSVVQYYNQVEAAVGLNDFFAGVFKCGIFGSIIAVAGCYRGLNCGRDATAVGQAATSAVVTSITWIVIADAIFAVSFHLLGI
ncbi:MAG: MlaE family ABC transporter permease [Opitutaceae bacterium]